MAEIWRTWDRLDREVILTEAGMAHILRRWLRMAGSEDAIMAMLRNPERIMKDALHSDRECFYGLRGDGPYLKVVVAYGNDGVGLVITAYPNEYVKRGEEPRWP